ncbi:MAG: hypothetical protein KDJ75_02845 [Alphaproteobacteria bacterium]|nr:hypothetical protein [Alphaproteobacteria bacterium]
MAIDPDAGLNSVRNSMLEFQTLQHVAENVGQIELDQEDSLHMGFLTFVQGLYKQVDKNDPDGAEAYIRNSIKNGHLTEDMLFSVVGAVPPALLNILANKILSEGVVASITSDAAAEAERDAHKKSELEKALLHAELVHDLLEELDDFFNNYAEEIADRVGAMLAAETLEERAQEYSALHMEFYERIRNEPRFKDLSDEDIHKAIDREILEYAEKALAQKYPDMGPEALRAKALQEIEKVQTYIKNHPEAFDSVTARHFMDYIAGQVSEDANLASPPGRFQEIADAVKGIQAEIESVYDEAKDVIALLPNESLQKSALGALESGNTAALHDHIHMALEFLKAESDETALIERLEEAEISLARLSAAEAGYDIVAEHLEKELAGLREEAQALNEHCAPDLIVSYNCGEIAYVEGLLTDLRAAMGGAGPLPESEPVADSSLAAGFQKAASGENIVSEPDTEVDMTAEHLSRRQVFGALPATSGAGKM